MGTGDEISVPNELLKQTEAELSFRRRVVELLGGILKSDAPNYFKVFVVILLFLGLTASCVLAMFFVAVTLAIVKNQPVNLPLFAGILTGHGFVAALLGAPLTMRMAALEEAHKLEDDLSRVQRIKQRKEKVLNASNSASN
jgi:hypothetical protein